MNEKYRRTPTSSWDSPQFRRLPAAKPCARYLLRFLQTGPHTNSVPGLFRAGVGGIAEQLGWAAGETRDLFDLLEREGWLQIDRDACLVFLPGSFDYEPPANAKSVLGWKTIVRELPDCELKQRACAVLHSRLKGLDAERGKPKDGNMLANAGTFLLLGDTASQTLVDTVSVTVPSTKPDAVSAGYAIPLSTDALSTDALSTDALSTDGTARAAACETVDNSSSGAAEAANNSRSARPPASEMEAADKGISRAQLVRILPALGIRDELDPRAHRFVAKVQQYPMEQVDAAVEAYLERGEAPGAHGHAYVVAMVAEGATPRAKKSPKNGAAHLHLSSSLETETPGRKYL